MRPRIIGFTRRGKPVYEIAGGSDNIAVTPGVGATVASDERTISATAVHVQRVSDEGGTAIANGQAAPTSTAATLVAARDTRKTLTLTNHGSVDVYIGVATVTTANGHKMPPGSSMDIDSTALIQGITASGTGAIHYVETYS